MNKNTTLDKLIDFQLLVMALGDTHNIHIQFVDSDSAAVTRKDGKYIMLLPKKEINTYNDMMMMRGFVDHECGHIRFSKENLEHIEDTTDMLKHHVQNILDDFRVEKLMSDLFAGSKISFAFLIKTLFIDKQEEFEGEQIDLALYYCLLYLRHNSYGGLQDKLDNVKDLLTFDITRTHTLLKSYSNSQLSINTMNAYAEEITELLRSLMPEQEEQEQGGDSSNKQDNENNDTQQPKSGQDGDITDGDSGSSNVKGKFSISDLIQAAIEQMDAAENSSSYDTANSAMKSARKNINSKKELNPTTLDIAESLVSESKSKIKRILASQTLVRASQSKRGKLNTRKLHRVVQNDNNLFLQYNKKELANTSVSILIDASSSMSASEMETACSAGYILSKSIDSIVGSCSSVGFFSDTFDGYIKRMNQKATTEMSVRSHGGTGFADSLLIALREQLSAKKDKKIILLITDGEPYDRDESLMFSKKIKKNKVEIFSIGVGTGANMKYLKELSTRAILVKNINDLSLELMNFYKNLYVRA